MAQIQTIILRNLIQNEEFTRKVIPFLKPEYFEGEYKHIFKSIASFVSKYNKMPTPEALDVELEDYEFDRSIIEDLKVNEQTDLEWIYDQTEKWCQDRSIYLAIMESISIIDGKHNKLTKDALPDLLSDALSVSFDSSVGHDYIDDSLERFRFYHKSEERIPFDLDLLNKITKNGLPNKTLNVCLAGTGAGKSLFMCHHAAFCLSVNKNVLYITLEMAEERIAERIDANLMNVPIDQLENMPKNTFENKISKITEKGCGKLIIKEYPTGSAHNGHFRALLNELKLKKDFVPDIIFIDYLNICASSRLKGIGGAVNTYSYVKAIAEELRGLSIEYNVPIFSATQTNRTGYSNSDVDITDTSESFGLPQTVDFLFALITTEELDQLNQVMIKQLKNRYNDPTYYKRFLVGIDRAKMRLYDIEESGQTLNNDIGSTSSYIPDVNKFKGIKV